MFNIKFPELQTKYLSGAGCDVGDTDITITNLVDILGDDVTMVDYFGVLGFATFEQGTANERQISFTDITQNGNGTATLNGCNTIRMNFPYDVVATGSDISHAGGTSVDFSDSPGLFDTFANKQNEGTITEVWSFTPGKNPAYLSQPPSFGPLDLIDFAALIGNTSNFFEDTGTVNNIVITPDPALAGYVEGQTFFIEVAFTNTSAVTIDVDGLGPIALKKQVIVGLDAGDILAGEIIIVGYDGTNFQLIGGVGGGGGNGGGGILSRSARTSFALIASTIETIDTDGTSGVNAGNLMVEDSVIKNLYVNSENNTLTGDTIYTLLRNGVPTSVTVTVPAGVNGVLQDVINSFAVVAGDLISLQCDTTASGSGTGNISFSYQVGQGHNLLSTFGDGSDGDVVISVPTTLTRDMYYNNLTINDVLTTDGFRIYVKNILDGTGSVIFNVPNDGGDGGSTSTNAQGLPGTGATASGSGFFGNIGGQDGGSGGAGGVGQSGFGGDPGVSVTSCIGHDSADSGRGGNAQSGGASGGSGGIGTATPPSAKFAINAQETIDMMDLTVGGVFTKYTENPSPGGGGGGGGDDLAGGGGGGGAGSAASGGIIWIATRVLAGSVTLDVHGGNGGNGGDSTLIGGKGGGGGGGAGGNGGEIIVIFETNIWSGVANVLGGTGGTGGIAGFENGVDGGNGTTGTFYQININDMFR